MKCWELKVRERPKFAQLVQQLNCLLEQEAGYVDLTRSLITATPAVHVLLNQQRRLWSSRNL